MARSLGTTTPCPVGRRIDRQPIDEDTEVETTYRFRATTRDANEAHVRALLLQSISGHGYQLRDGFLSAAGR